ncbi:hypothetical protein VTL71DRAFT_5034 [Oculimacula yallundae]|uniref:Uncharacterized protein n=1 Tax=Oculimacula yallundae TaxID=86028 RepID=A0ABR4C052_9HELO
MLVTIVTAIIPLDGIALPEIRANASLGDRDSGGLPLAFPSCDMTWPMEEMPHDDVAGFCLAAPCHYASGEGSWTDFCQTWLCQMTFCMTMAASQPLLSIPRTEYETPALGEWTTNRQTDMEDCEEAGHTTSEGARSAAVQHNYTPEYHFYNGKVVWPHLHGDGHRLQGKGVVDWIPSNIRVITGRFLDLRTKLNLGRHTAAASGKAVWTRPVQFRQASVRGSPLKSLNSPR